MSASKLIFMVILAIVAILILAITGIVVRAIAPKFLNSGDFEPALEMTDGISIPVWGIAFPPSSASAGLFRASSILPLSEGGGVIYGVCYHHEKIDFYLAQFDNEGNVIREKAYGGNRREEVASARPLLTSEGGHLFTGSTNSFSDGLVSDGWLIKTDAGGSVEWSRVYGQAGKSTSLMSVKALADGGYVLLGTSNAVSGYSREDWWIVRLDAERKILWQKVYGGREKRDSPHDIIPTHDGDFLCIGETASFAAGYSNAWIIRLDSSGAIVWQKSFGNKGYNRARSLVLVPETGYAVAGFMTEGGEFDRRGWILMLDFRGEVLWQKLFGLPGKAEFSTITLTKDGSLLTAGSRRAEGSEISEGFLMRVGIDGSPRWQRIYNGEGNVVLRDAAEAADGGLLVLGRSSMPPDKAAPQEIPEYVAFILKLTADGRPVFHRSKKSTFGVQADLQSRDYTPHYLTTEADPVDTKAEPLTTEGPSVTTLDLEHVRLFPFDR